MESNSVSHHYLFADAGRRELGSLASRRIYIVGSRGFQNELLMHFLEQRMDITCRAVDDPRQVPAGQDERLEPKQQILWDLLGKNRTRVVTELETEGRKILGRHLVALLNVRSGLGVEERAVGLGVRGVFYENDPLDLFAKGVQAIFQGELWLSRELMTRCILDKGNDSSVEEEQTMLTPRENEILELVVVGATNDEIAQRLYISPHTVKTHVYNIFKKINVPNRFQAALWAAKNL